MSRNDTLDFIRGVAILGIVLLNITAFGLPDAAYLNPAWQGEPTESSKLVWLLLSLVAQNKFLTLLALLFGASLILQQERRPHYIQPRLIILSLLGITHGVLLWSGDILLDYALVGLLIWRIVLNTPGTAQLAILAGLFCLIAATLLISFGIISPSEPGVLWSPTASDLRTEESWKLEGGWPAIQQRLEQRLMALIALFSQYGWHLAGLMLAGAALFRCGWLAGNYSLQHYRRVALWLLPVCLAAQCLLSVTEWLSDWDFRLTAFFLRAPQELIAAGQSIGYIALCYGFWPRLATYHVTRYLICTGRMAVSNYLLQTLLCSLLFYRFGGYAQFTLPQLMGFVPAIWATNLVFSTLWLRFYPYGPVEAVWRWSVRKLSGQ